MQGNRANDEKMECVRSVASVNLKFTEQRRKCSSRHEPTVFEQSEKSRSPFCAPAPGTPSRRGVSRPFRQGACFLTCGVEQSKDLSVYFLLTRIFILPCLSIVTNVASKDIGRPFFVCYPPELPPGKMHEIHYPKTRIISVII